MSDISLARTELVALLTPIASVRTGRAALETTSATLPVITLWSTSDVPATDQGYAAPAYTRTVLLEYKAAASATYDADLDAVLRRIRLAIKPPIGGPPLDHALAIRETAVRFFAPDLTQNSGDIAVMQITLEIDYLERLL